MVYNNVPAFLEQYSENNVNYCCSNFGGIEFAANLVKSCNLVCFPIVFFALDEKSSIYMRKYCDVVNYYKSDSNKLKITRGITSGYSRWGSKKFNALNWPAWEIAVRILSSQRSVIKLDTDIFVKRNFQQDILGELDFEHFDYLFQNDIRNLLCAGVCGIHHLSYSTVKKIFSEDYLSSLDYFNSNDQQILRYLVREKEIKIKLLDKNLYPSGRWFYKHHEKIRDRCNLIHFNWITTGKESKVSKMKGHDCWLLSD